MTVALWNTVKDELSITLTLDSIPFASGTLEVYHIDEGHNSWYETGDGTLTVSRSERIGISDGRAVLNDVVRSRGVCFMRIVADDAATLFPKVKLGTIVRTHQWFPKRTNAASYALFDPQTWTVRLSSNKDVAGLALVGIETTNMPDVLKVDGLRGGRVQKRNVNSSLNIRVDYQGHDGRYVRSVLFHEGIYNSGRNFVLPWGTRQIPDEVVQVESLNDCFLDIAAYKPSDFNGRLIISFEMQSVGTGVKQNFQLTKGNATGIGLIPKDSTDKGSARTTAIYDLNGRRMRQLVRGTNIVSYSDGLTHKVYVP